jgi:hypothetical protein
MRMTSLFLAGFGFAVPYAEASPPIPEEAVKRLVTQQMCVRDCDTQNMRELSNGTAERAARNKLTMCKLYCNDVFTGRRPAPVQPAAVKSVD